MSEAIKGLAEIGKRMEALREQRRVAKAQLLELEKERNLLIARAKVARLSKAERATLAQAITAEGISSEEAVGSPGT